MWVMQNKDKAVDIYVITDKEVYFSGDYVNG